MEEKEQRNSTKYFAIYDTLAEKFMPLFNADNSKVAKRMVVDSIRNNPAHCEDLELFYVFEITSNLNQLFVFSSKISSVQVSHTEGMINNFTPVKIGHFEFDENDKPKFIDDYQGDKI